MNTPEQGALVSLRIQSRTDFATAAIALPGHSLQHILSVYASTALKIVNITVSSKQTSQTTPPRHPGQFWSTVISQIPALLCLCSLENKYWKLNSLFWICLSTFISSAVLSNSLVGVKGLGHLGNTAGVPLLAVSIYQSLQVRTSSEAWHWTGEHRLLLFPSKHLQYLIVTHFIYLFNKYVSSTHCGGNTEGHRFAPVPGPRGQCECNLSLALRFLKLKHPACTSVLFQTPICWLDALPGFHSLNGAS